MAIRNISTQLDSTSMYGRRCKHLNVRIYLTQHVQKFGVKIGSFVHDYVLADRQTDRQTDGRTVTVITILRFPRSNYLTRQYFDYVA